MYDRARRVETKDCGILIDIEAQRLYLPVQRIQRGRFDLGEHFASAGTRHGCVVRWRRCRRMEGSMGYSRQLLLYAVPFLLTVIFTRHRAFRTLGIGSLDVMKALNVQI